jgi:hypothetical protein
MKPAQQRKRVPASGLGSSTAVTEASARRARDNAPSLACIAQRTPFGLRSMGDRGAPTGSSSPNALRGVEGPATRNRRRWHFTRSVTRRLPSHPKTASDLERTTGFEPATPPWQAIPHILSHPSPYQSLLSVLVNVVTWELSERRRTGWDDPTVTRSVTRVRLESVSQGRTLRGLRSPSSWREPSAGRADA